MSLQNIRARIDSEAGFNSVLNEDDKTYLNQRINAIATELYDKQDLVGSMFEVIGFWDNDTKLVSFPPSVGEVRGAHYYDSPVEITLRDIRPRYATGFYGIQLKDFRELGISSLAVQMDNYSGLSFSLPEGEVAEKDIVITIIGQTPVSTRKQERVTILTGENSVTSTNNWIGAPETIKKLEACEFDITVMDIEETELAIIPNNALLSEYLIFQVRDDNMVGQLSSNSIEILYKKKLEPLVNEGDEFLSGKYDEVILWKFLEEFWSTQEGKEKQVANAQFQYASKLSAINNKKSSGKKIEMQTVPNRFYSLFSRYNWGNIKYP